MDTGGNAPGTRPATNIVFLSGQAQPLKQCPGDRRFWVAAPASSPPQPDQPQPQVVGMWDQEFERPWLYAGLYLAAMLVGLLGHHVAGWVAALWGGA